MSPLTCCTWCNPSFFSSLSCSGHRSSSMTIVSGSFVPLFILLVAVECIRSIIHHAMSLQQPQGIPFFSILLLCCVGLGSDLSFALGQICKGFGPYWPR